jgi:hypothetical protein
VSDPLSLVALCLFVGLFARLYGLDLVFTSDEGYWMQRTVRFGDALYRGDFLQTYRSGHPGVTVMWTGLLGIGIKGAESNPTIVISNPQLLERASNFGLLMRQSRRAITVVAAVLFAFAVLLAGRLLGPAGALGGVLVALDPYTIGMTRLLHVDALLAPLVLVSVLAGLIFWLGRGRWPFLALSAVTGGLALLTKAPAITLLPFFGLVWLVSARPWRGNPRSWLSIVGWGLLLTAVYFAAWPALWVQPVEVLKTVAEFAVTLGGTPHTWPTYFLGAPTTGDPGLLFYPVAIVLRLGPVASLGLLALVVLAATGRLRGNAPVIWLLVFVVIFVDIMAIGSKKFDRYMLPVLAVLTVAAGVGIWGVGRLLRRRLQIALVALAVAAQAAWLVTEYPYPIAAYNPLAGGTAAARQLIMVGWGEGLEQTAAYMNGLPNAEGLTTSTQYHHVLRPQVKGRTVRVPSDRTIDYFVVYVNMVQRNLVPPQVLEKMATTPPVYTALVNGVPFAWVYQGPFSISSVPADVTDDGESDVDPAAP